MPEMATEWLSGDQAASDPGCLRGESSFRVGDRRCPEFRLSAQRINSNRWVLEHVPIPLRIRAVHRQQVELIAIQNKPDRNRDGLSRISADHAELDLAVARKTFSESFL
jgi:hypothetical protein